METMQSINLVSTNPRVRNGRPCIAGTTIEIATIATAKVLGGQEPEEIAADLELSLSQVNRPRAGVDNTTNDFRFPITDFAIAWVLPLTAQSRSLTGAAF
ncbi:MAG: DUF433 domain-containing protein [Chloroflexi bacterium]|nr:DUF433 domain-containing protein [Chloroflexota bacterium]